MKLGTSCIILYPWHYIILLLPWRTAYETCTVKSMATPRVGYCIINPNRTLIETILESRKSVMYNSADAAEWSIFPRFSDFPQGRECCNLVQEARIEQNYDTHFLKIISLALWTNLAEYKNCMIWVVHDLVVHDLGGHVSESIISQRHNSSCCRAPAICPLSFSIFYIFKWDTQEEHTPLVCVLILVWGARNGSTDPCSWF